MRKFFLRAAAKVVRGGLKSVAWLKATMSASLVDWFTAIAEYMVSSISSVTVAANDIVFSGKLISHSLGECWLRSPCMIVLPLRLIVASFLVKVQTQPASQSCPMLKRCVSPRAGKMSVRVASGGR